MKSKKYLILFTVFALIVMIAAVAFLVTINTTATIGAIPGLVEARYWGEILGFKSLLHRTRRSDLTRPRYSNQKYRKDCNQHSRLVVTQL